MSIIITIVAFTVLAVPCIICLFRRPKIKMNKHSGDCSIYSSLVNGNPEDGICTCGYGFQKHYDGDWSKMYSAELKEKLLQKKHE